MSGIVMRPITTVCTRNSRKYLHRIDQKNLNSPIINSETKISIMSVRKNDTASDATTLETLFTPIVYAPSAFPQNMKIRK